MATITVTQEYGMPIESIDGIIEALQEVRDSLPGGQPSKWKIHIHGNDGVRKIVAQTREAIK